MPSTTPPAPVSKSAARFLEQARRLVAARCSLVFVDTHEEQRLEHLLSGLVRQSSRPVPLLLWSVTEGLCDAGGQPLAGTTDPIVALETVMTHAEPALFLFRDLQRLLDDARVVRRMRDAERALRPTYKTVFVCGPGLSIPLELQRVASVLDLPLPDLQDMDAIFARVLASMPQHAELDLGDRRDVLLRGALGLTEEEARQAFAKLLVSQRAAGPDMVERLYEEKRALVRKEGVLDYVPPRVNLEQIGGLATLKRWLQQRQRFFSREAAAFGLDPPKGLLVTGISGCGKSMAVQAVSAYWGMPLVRLDMNRIYAGIAGTPEATLERAIRTAEAIAPCVMWIDEIETALVGTGAVASAATRIFSSFLTWMQEKEQIVFVAATANEIDQLPPELLRKGRFDEIFFVDLPSESERVEIFTVHLRQRDKDPAAFDLTSLAKSTGGFNGAEIEQVVLGGMFAAFEAGRAPTMKDFYGALGRMVPLSTTMSERIKAIKRWADTRAVRAS